MCGPIPVTASFLTIEYLLKYFSRIYLMCEYEPVILALVIILLTINILLLLFSLTEKICVV